MSRRRFYLSGVGVIKAWSHQVYTKTYPSNVDEWTLKDNTSLNYTEDVYPFRFGLNTNNSWDNGLTIRVAVSGTNNSSISPQPQYNSIRRRQSTNNYYFSFTHRAEDDIVYIDGYQYKANTLDTNYGATIGSSNGTQVGGYICSTDPIYTFSFTNWVDTPVNQGITIYTEVESYAY